LNLNQVFSAQRQKKGSKFAHDANFNAQAPVMGTTGFFTIPPTYYSNLWEKLNYEGGIFVQ
jgi:hypothetical protein